MMILLEHLWRVSLYFLRLSTAGRGVREYVRQAARRGVNVIPSGPSHLASRAVPAAGRTVARPAVSGGGDRRLGRVPDCSQSAARGTGGVLPNVPGCPATFRRVPSEGEKRRGTKRSHRRRRPGRSFGWARRVAGWTRRTPGGCYQTLPIATTPPVRRAGRRGATTSGDWNCAAAGPHGDARAVPARKFGAIGPSVAPTPGFVDVGRTSARRPGRG